MKRPRLIIVGAGQAAAQLIASLRADGFEGPVTLVGEEAYPPYQRPPLSKAFLKGEIGLDRVILKADSFYEEAGVELRLGRRAVAIDRDRRMLRLDSGERLGFDRLVLATGSRVRRLSCPGHDLSNIFYLRGIDDVEAIRPHLVAGARLAVIGAGYIGLEVAAVARGLGLEVTVLEAAPRVMMRVTAPQMSSFFEAVHREAGVRIACGTMVEAIEGAGRAEAVRLADGRRVEADVIIVGIGIVPACVALAEAAGLACDNGIAVDALTRTSDPRILAIGDCTSHPSLLYGHRVRLESVQNAIGQAKTAAAHLLGRDQPYDEVPWFWSDQYALKLQIAGLNAGYDRVVLRGDPATRAFAAFYLSGGVLIAVDAVNRPPDYMLGRKAIGERARPDPERLADPDIPLKDILS